MFISHTHTDQYNKTQTERSLDTTQHYISYSSLSWLEVSNLFYFLSCFFVFDISKNYKLKILI